MYVSIGRSDTIEGLQPTFIMSGAPRSNIHAGMFGISGSELQAQEEIVTSSDSSGTHSKQSRPSFVALRDEWDNLSATFIERHNWSIRLEEEKGPLLVTDFFAWMDSDPGFSLDAFEKLGKEEFDACLARSDWKQNNEFLGKVNARLWRQYHSIEPEFRLGTYEGTPLALRLNGRALGQRETESWLCEYHDITALNVGPLFGMRYQALDNEIREFLLVPLGKSSGAYLSFYSFPLSGITNPSQETCSHCANRLSEEVILGSIQGSFGRWK